MKTCRQGKARIFNFDTLADGVGQGYLDVARAEALYESGAAKVGYNRDVRVALTPYLERGEDGRVRPAAHLAALDVGNIFGEAVHVSATVTHDGQSQSVTCITDASTGECTLTGDWVTLGDPSGHAWAIEANAITYAGGITARPTSVMFATDTLEAILAAAQAEGVAPGSHSLGVFWEEGSDAALGDLAASFAFWTGGTGLATSPIGVVATPAALFPGVLQDDPLGTTGTGLATSPIGFATMDLSASLSTSGTGLATSPIGFLSLSPADIGSVDGTGLATSPIGFTSLDFSPFDLNLDGTGLATSPFGFVPVGLLDLSGLTADGSDASVLMVDGTGLATSPIGLHGTDLLLPGDLSLNLAGASFEGGEPIYDLDDGASGILVGSSVGASLDAGGFVSASGYDVASLMAANTASGSGGASAGGPVYVPGSAETVDAKKKEKKEKKEKEKKEK